MDGKIEKILARYKGNKAGIFVDEANLFYSQKTAGWHIDWGKFLDFCRKYFYVGLAKYYLGMPLEKAAYDKNVLIKSRIKKSGFEIIEKPLKKIYLDNSKAHFKYKCNFDVEITRDAIRNLGSVDLVLIASSDSDFIGLKSDIIYHDKKFIFACFEKNAPWEIRKSHHIFFEDIKNYIQYQNNKSPEN